MNIKLLKVNNYLEWIKLKLLLDSRAIVAKGRMIKRGQVYYCDLGVGVGSEESKNRPCVIIQNDKGNKYSGNTVVAPITNGSNMPKITVPIPVNKYLYTDKDGNATSLSGNILLGNIVTVSKARLGDLVCTLDNSEIDDLNNKVRTVLGLYKEHKKLKDTQKKDKAFIKKILLENKKLLEKNKKLLEK